MDGKRNYSKAHTSLLRRDCSFMRLFIYGPGTPAGSLEFGATLEGNVSFWQHPKSNSNSKRAHWSQTSSTIFSIKVRSSWEEALLSWLAIPLLTLITMDCLWSLPPPLHVRVPASHMCGFSPLACADFTLTCAGSLPACVGLLGSKAP